MTLQTMISPLMEIPPMMSKAGTNFHTTTTLDAAGEQGHYVGRIFLEDGSGSKTISAAGGKICWRTSTPVTFANAGTTFRIGIQDVSTAASPAQGDGTNDVYATLVGGTDALAAGTLYATPMASGTKTISHGQMVAVVFDMVSRGGTDSIPLSNYLTAQTPVFALSPAVMLNTGSFSRHNAAPNCVIEFDDGTIGWFAGGWVTKGTGTVAFNSDTGTADEYGNVITLPFPVRAMGIGCNLVTANASADYELCLYSDPFGSPVLITAIAVDATQLGGQTGTDWNLFTSGRILSANTPYAITLRPTTINNVTAHSFDVAVSSHLKVSGFGDSCYAINRLDNSGPFADYNGGDMKTRRIHISLLVDQFNDAGGNAQYFLGV